MQDDLEEINQKLLDVLNDIQRLFTKRMNKMTKAALDPLLQDMLKSMGIDFSQLRGMASGQIAVDPYRIMGLDRSASDEEVKHRFQELVNRLHPDKSGTSGTNFLFQMVMAAFEIIKKMRGWQ